MQVPSSFILCTWSLSVSSLSQSCCLVLSSGIKHNHLPQGCLLSSSSLVGNHTLFQYHPWSKVWYGGRLPYSIQFVRLQGWANWEIIRVWVFWFIHHLLAVAYLQPTSFIGRISLVCLKWLWPFLDKGVSFELTTRRF